MIYKSGSFFSANQNCWNYTYAPTARYAKYRLAVTTSELKNTRKNSLYITGVRSFKEVTGIKFNAERTEASVEYTVMRERVTPFGRAIGKENEAVYLVQSFELYDDGWRIIGDNSMTVQYSPSQFPFLY